MTEIEIFGKCLSLGMTPAGAAGATANILAESAGRANNVEDRSGIDDAAYTQSVDNGTYGGFTLDRFGYGLCQWTLPSRKTALLKFCRNFGKSIGDADRQFQFMASEMRSDYPHTWSVLTHTEDPYEAGYVMCKEYEIPQYTEQESKRRGEQARAIYKRCSGTEPAVPKEDGDITEAFWPPRTIDKTMKGADVAVLQALLVAHGYTVTSVSGYFDGATENAVKKFQKDHYLVNDGIAGPKTWSAILKR